MWDYDGAFRKKLQAILDEPDATTHLDAIMRLVDEEIDRIEENHGYDVREAVERATGDW